MTLTDDEMGDLKRLIDEVNRLIKDDVMAFRDVPKNIEKLKERLIKKLKEYDR